MRTTYTLAQLVTTIFGAYEEAYGERDIAAVATAATLNELFLGERDARRRRLRPLRPRREVSPTLAKTA